MVRTIVCMSLLPALEGCASQQAKAPPNHQASLHNDRAGYGDTHRLSACDTPSPHAGQWAGAVIGTPVYPAMKTVVCGGTSPVVAAPKTAVIALFDSPYASGADTLVDGVAIDVLSPS